MLEAYDEGELKARFPVGVGRSDTPTPLGIWELAPKTFLGDPDVVASLSTPSLVCLRETHEIDSIGAAMSGG